MFKIVRINGITDPITIELIGIGHNLAVGIEGIVVKGLDRMGTVMEGEEIDMGLIVVEGILREGGHIQVIKGTVIMVHSQEGEGKTMER